MFQSQPVYIVAEIGQNHQGSVETAKLMIREAKACGVDAVKFQKSNLSAKFTSSALNRPYDSPASFGATYGDHKRFLEFTVEQMKELRDIAEEIGVDFGVSPMDPVSMEEMIQLQPKFLKIGSGDTDNFPMIRTAIKSGLPLIVSTGMQKKSTIKRVMEMLKKNAKNFAILHCISSYPMKEQDANLSQMLSLMDEDVPVGYSGHEEGFNPTVMAVMLGARVVERHFTLDKNLKGSDHKCSLEPQKLTQLVGLIRKLEGSSRTRDPLELQRKIDGIDSFDGVFIESVMGIPRTDEIYTCEQPCRDKLGKSIVYSSNLKSGSVLREVDLCIKVCNGRSSVSPDLYDLQIGRTLAVDVEKDGCLEEGHFAPN